MKAKSQTTQRVKYIVDIKIIKNIKKGMIKYSVKDMKRDLDEVWIFLKERGFHDEARLVNIIMYKLGHLDIYEEEVLNNLASISNVIHQVIEKEKTMNEREIESRYIFKKNVTQQMKGEKGRATLQKYDVVKIPTQGGFHCSVVYDVVREDMILCYPITTSSTRSLRMLGNRSHVIQDCGCPEYDGYRLSSAAAYVSKEKASYCKMGHIINHEEIDNAIQSFN